MLEETGDVYEYKDDSGRCYVRTRIGAHENVNPLYFSGRIRSANVSGRKHLGSHLNVNPTCGNAHPHSAITAASSRVAI